MKKRCMIIAACLLLAFLGGCGKKQKPDQQEQTESQTQMMKEENQTDTQQNQENGSNASQTAQGQSANADSLAGGSAGDLIYEIKYEQKSFQAEDNAVIFEAKLAYPVLIGEEEFHTSVNSFFEMWKNSKLKEYEQDDDAAWRQALEVYRESKDAGWMGAWSEEYDVNRVTVQNGYANVLMESWLYEGGNHGVSSRESYWFRRTDGCPTTLFHESRMTEDQWETMLEKKFYDLITSAPEAEFFDDAAEIIDDVDWDEVDAYIGDTGIVFYLPPAQIGPYSSGFAEVIVSYEEIFGTH